MEEENDTKNSENSKNAKSAKNPKNAKNAKNYYIADISASSDDDYKKDDGADLKNYKQKSYVEVLKEEVASSSYNRELQEHIRQTLLREEMRQKQIGARPALPLAAEEEGAALGLGEEERSIHGDGGVTIRYKSDGKIIDEYEDLKTEKLLPSLADPRLWKVNCRPRKERESVLEVLSVCKRREAAKRPLSVFCAFTTDLCRGYIYVEAYERDDVLELVALVKTLYRSRIFLVPVLEMTETLKVRENTAKVEIGSWVRINRGSHKNDIALVTDTFDEGQKVEIQLVPRLNFSLLKQQVLSLQNSQARKKPGARQIQRAETASFVPPARPFNEDELRRFLEQTCETNVVDSLFYHSRGAVFFRNLQFLNGYRVIKVALRSLKFDPQPTEDELRKFQSANSAMDGEGGLKSDSSFLTGREKAEPLRIDDSVRVVAGDLAGLTGKVTSLRAESVLVMPNHPQLNEALKFSSADLEKFFEVGAHVKVLSGTYKNETGFVTEVDDEEKIIKIFSDTSQKIIQTGIKQAIETTEISCGKSQLGGYTIFDFVQVDRDTCGVIVHVMAESFKILTDKGETNEYSLKDILRKLAPTHSRALDSRNCQLGAGDVAKVVSKKSHFLGTTGTVLGIARAAVFLRAPSAGVFAVPARALAAVGSRPAQPGLARQRHWVGRSVTVLRGSHKGRAGRVRSAPSPGRLQLELLSEDRLVTVDCGDVEELRAGEAGSARGAGTGRASSRRSETPLLGAETPLAGLCETPAHRGAEPFTPVWGAKTPAHRGAEPFTPVWGAKTPLYGGGAEGEWADGRIKRQKTDDFFGK